EQPHVLDGDHRLVGEGFEELDMALREGTFQRPGHRDRSSAYPIAKHWDRQVAPKPKRPLQQEPTFGFSVWHVDDRAFQNGAPDGDLQRRPKWKCITGGSQSFWRETVVGCEVNECAVEAIQCSEQPIDEPDRASNDRIEDRLDVSRRTTDDAQDLARRRL